jgi:rubrerythrin
VNGEGREREIDYLVCKECNTPCYVFEVEGDAIREAICPICGNDENERFSLGEIEEE